MTTSESEPPPIPSPRRRKGWLLFALFMITFLGGMTLWFLHITARSPLIGKTDPATGFRYVATIGQGWKQEPSDNGFFSPHFIDSSHFRPTPLPPYQVWIEQHLLHRLPIGQSQDSDMNRFEVTSYHSAKLSFLILRDGYPEPDPNVIRSFGFSIAEMKRLEISGQPATWVVIKLSLPIPTPPQTVYIGGLLVKVRDKPLYYTIVSTFDEPHRNQVENEMRNVRDSLRLERVGEK